MFAITDNQTNNPFWLMQTPNKVDAVPLPAAAWLLLSGLGGLGLVGRRRKAA